VKLAAVKTRRPILVVLAAALAVFVAALAVTARPGDPDIFPARPGEPAIMVYFVSNGFHTDIALPTQALETTSVLRQAAEIAAGGPPPAWSVIGWGDARFYTQAGLSWRRAVDALRALLHPANPSVVRVYGLSRDPAEAFRDPPQRILLSKRGFDRMVGRIEISLRRPLVTFPAAAEHGTAFFESGEYFSLLRLCNRWTSDVLDAAGAPTMPLTDGVAQPFMAGLHLRGVFQTD